MTNAGDLNRSRSCSEKLKHRVDRHGYEEGGKRIVQDDSHTW